jgi:hypothetical protein
LHRQRYQTWDCLLYFFIDVILQAALEFIMYVVGFQFELGVRINEYCAALFSVFFVLISHFGDLLVRF